MPDTLRLHIGPRIWAWLFQVLAGWLFQVLAGWLAGKAGRPAGGVGDYLAPRALLDWSASGPVFVFVPGYRGVYL